jgi:hypothetical protein
MRDIKLSNNLKFKYHTIEFTSCVFIADGGPSKSNEHPFKDFIEAISKSPLKDTLRVIRVSNCQIYSRFAQECLEQFKLTNI